MDSNNNHNRTHHQDGGVGGRRKASVKQGGGSWNRESGCPFHCFSLVVCRDPTTELWLAVEETNNRGWWLPGGFVECGDDFYSTAHKETREEAGIEITLKGILRIENTMSTSGARQRVIFYAEPTTCNQIPKDIPDTESVRAAWLSTDELATKHELPPPQGLRGAELLDWATYIEGGGLIYPLQLLSHEETPIPNNPSSRSSVEKQPRRHHRSNESSNNKGKEKNSTHKLPSPKSTNSHNNNPREYRDSTKPSLSPSNHSETTRATTTTASRHRTSRASFCAPPPPTATQAAAAALPAYGRSKTTENPPVVTTTSRPSFSLPPPPTKKW